MVDKANTMSENENSLQSKHRKDPSQLNTHKFIVVGSVKLPKIQAQTVSDTFLHNFIPIWGKNKIWYENNVLTLCSFEDPSTVKFVEKYILLVIRFH